MLELRIACLNHLAWMYNRDFTEAVALPATVNCLMEAGALRQPPPLMMINDGGSPKLPVSIKQLTKAVSIMRPP